MSTQLEQEEDSWEVTSEHLSRNYTSKTKLFREMRTVVWVGRSRAVSVRGRCPMGLMPLVTGRDLYY